MVAPERVIIDTSAFYALVSSSDTYHAQARLGYGRLVDWEWELWTTSYIITEISTLVQRRLGPECLSVLMETILSGDIRVLWIENVIHREAWRQMSLTGDTQLSFVDWTTVVSAQRLNASVFTFNREFHQQGVLVFSH